MSNALIVNPYLQFQPFVDDDSSFNLTAPKPGEGLRTLTVSQSEQPEIFEVFTDLSQTRFDFLDPDKDLSGNERELLFENGVLVEPEAKPEKPLFHCDLEDLEEWNGEITREDLIVNPTFRFEPFDLANFAVLAKQKHLSPYNASAWIESPVTDIEIGYWLSNADSQIISQLTAGESLPNEIDEQLLRKLIAARIVVSPLYLESERDIWNGKIDTARTEFANDKYTVLRGLFPMEQMSAMGHYYRQYVDQGFMPFGDPQVERRYREHNEPLAAFLHSKFSKLMSMIVGEDVKLSYVYAASYKEGSVLTPHTDREQCEFSISFQVDYEPAPPDNISPWAIYVEPLSYSGELPESGISFEWGELEAETSSRKPSAIHLASGDGLIYKGRELVHYRRALPKGHRSTSLFFHFVRADFQGALN